MDKERLEEVINQVNEFKSSIDAFSYDISLITDKIEMTMIRNKLLENENAVLKGKGVDKWKKKNAKLEKEIEGLKETIEKLVQSNVSLQELVNNLTNELNWANFRIEKMRIANWEKVKDA